VHYHTVADDKHRVVSYHECDLSSIGTETDRDWSYGIDGDFSGVFIYPGRSEQPVNVYKDITREMN